MHPVPEEVKKKIEAVSDGREIDFAVESDLGGDGSIGRQWLLTAGDRLYVVCEDHGAPVVCRDVAIKDLSEVRAEPLVGSGCVVANIASDYVSLIRYSNAMAKEFGHALDFIDNDGPAAWIAKKNFPQALGSRAIGPE